MNSVAVTPGSGAAECGVRPAVNWGDPRLPGRFWDKTSPCPLTGCWHWLGFIDGTTPTWCAQRGSSRQTSARRDAYDVLVAVLPDFVNIGASECGSTCCNPSHALVRAPGSTGPDRDLQLARRRQAAWRAQNKEQIYFGELRRQYGITREQFFSFWEEQGGACGACRKAFGHHNRKKNNYRVVRVDHCHGTKVVRGLLCQSCNSGIGLLGDNADGVRSALDYLERHAAKAEK